MTSDETPAPDGVPDVRDPLADALAELRAERAPGAGEPVDQYWLRTGIGLGIRQPGRAKLLLDALETAAAAAAAHPAVAAGAAGATVDTPIGAAAARPSTAPDDDGPADAVPVRSMLLARSATLPPDAAAEMVFGWAGRLSPDEVTWMGRIVGEMVGSGASGNLARGFGLAWSDGVHLPREELNALFGRFTQLEIAVGGVLAGRDLALTPAPRVSGVTMLLQAFLPKNDPAAAEASAVIDRGGEPARRGLVALWNAWAAMRFRPRIPAPLFEQLVRPWVTVIGPLPES